MKILKRTLLVLLILIAIPLIVALFLPKDFSIRHSITIARPRTEVFSYISQLKHQNEFSKWALTDPNMKTSFRGVDGTPGFVSAWDGNDDVGKGEQEIIAIKEGERMDTEIRFEKPFESKAAAYMSVSDVGPGQTQVEWAFQGRQKWPWNFMTLFMEKSVGNDLQTGLNNLKNRLESGPAQPM
jgi:hypothetical protein